MTYVFVFLGEFGYELLNWQGVVRKFIRLNPRARVICASRGGVAQLYGGTRYIDIGDVPGFRASVATGYSAVVEGDDHPASDRNVAFDRELRRELRAAILDRLREQMGLRASALRLRGMRFVFSSDKTRISECTFGADPRLFGSVPAEGDIYDLLDLHNNFYVRIEPDLDAAGALEAKGVDLHSPYILVQGRKRAIRARAPGKIDEAGLLAALARRMPVRVAEFSTGRAQDSFSDPGAGHGVQRVQVSGFAEQSCLIHLAAACVFLTEGDFGSHIYVPPLLGRDVYAVAPRGVYELGTTPIEFWNRHVFRFGGAVRPLVAEGLDADELAGRLAG